MLNVNVLKADQSVLTINAKRPSTWKPITFRWVLFEVAKVVLRILHIERHVIYVSTIKSFLLMNGLWDVYDGCKSRCGVFACIQSGKICMRFANETTWWSAI